MNGKNNRISTIILIFMLILGLSLLLYPSFSNYWNSFFQSRAIADYANVVSEIDNDKYAEMISEAKAYNETLRERGNRWILTEDPAIFSFSQTFIISFCLRNQFIIFIMINF